MVHPILDVVLASISPRRKELLARVIPEFEVFAPEVDEESMTVDDPWQTARSLAWAKASAGFAYRTGAIVIGADTVVALPVEEKRWRQLAKPADDADAIRMLEALSGRRHAVITAVAIRSPEVEQEFTDTAWVTFRHLTRQEIEAYVATGEPHDKAGAYAIQGGASGFVREVEGFESTVIGLPLEILELELLRTDLAKK